MTYKEVMCRVTGFNVPGFGLSWNPLEPDVRAARRVLAFLEDRRLFNMRRSYDLQVEAECIKSAQEIRQFLTAEIGDREADNELGQRLRAIRAALRQFLDTVGTHSRTASPLSPDVRFFEALGKLRATVGVNVGLISVMFRLPVEGELAELLPPEPE